MAKLSTKSKLVKQLADLIDEENVRRPTRRTRLLYAYYVVWLAGLSGEVPPIFQDLVTGAENKEDPEYTEYLRLKSKFDS